MSEIGFALLVCVFIGALVYRIVRAVFRWG